MGPLYDRILWHFGAILALSNRKNIFVILFRSESYDARKIFVLLCCLESPSIKQPGWCKNVFWFFKTLHFHLNSCVNIRINSVRLGINIKTIHNS